MSPRFKGLWRPSLFKLMLMILLLLAADTWIVCANKRNLGSQQQNAGEPSRSPTTDLDPMEPCYLSNNRASESLTISESTPVGTVVGEIMVNGDSSANGNIELSIKLPGGNSQTNSEASRQAIGASQRQPRQTNGSSSSKNPPTTSGQPTEWPPSAGGLQPGVKSARDLNNLIHLMPPLSIEHDTKRLILAKKLDRENLDRYILAGGYQASPISSLSQSSSASLTVHIKCQLRDRSGSGAPARGGSLEQNTTRRISTAKHANSILIPIHLIVTDENDNWPVFINAPYIVDLNETVPIGAPLPGNEIVAVDNDQQGPLSTIEYSIVAGSFWSDSFGFLNPLDSRSLIVKDNRLLDYESQSKITLKVMARDQGEPPNWAISSLYINLLDNDDLSPVFSEDKYLGYVRENRPGEVVDLLPKRLSARDGDQTINAPILYSFHLKTNHSVHFELDPEVGRLSLKKTLPEEPANQPLCLLIRATQVGNPQRWSLTMAQVRVERATLTGHLEQLLAIGDRQLPASQSAAIMGNEPQVANFRFAQPNYTVQVSEAAPAGYTLLSLKAAYNQPKEPSSVPVEGVTYHLLDDELGYFNLDPRSGRLSLNRSLDYELYRQLSVRVLATSDDSQLTNTGRMSLAGQLPRLACDLVRVNVHILAHNDYTPEFSHEQYNFQLSVSDLIANFDLPKLLAGGSTSGAAEASDDFDDDNRSRGDTTTNELRSELTKRFGNLEVLDESLEEPLAWPAMQLGQVYCADRDYGDRVSLQLIGSKASLFHLTQDGRLHLPLVNISASNDRHPSISSGDSAGPKRGETPAWSHGRQSRIIDNQFVQSGKFFARRRGDSTTQPYGLQEPPDRDYLNYLLGEFSNLGRLRLKVLASDDGEPQQRQTTALIVITVISIDNFILQRAPHLPLSSNNNDQQQAVGVRIPASQLSEAGAIQLNNNTSYDTSRPEPPEGSRENNRSLYSSHVMMIPATNGRSFVQINPDIIGNLISQNALNNANNTDLARGDPSAHAQILKVPTGSSGRSWSGNGSTELQSEAESTIQSQTSARFQPPSLLLVDDDGAKFVAMPAAIEVYNRQVQEAAEQQQARQRGQTSSAAKRAHENSLWHQWKSQFGLVNSRDSPSGQQTGSLYWLNLSTAIMLHLIALVVVVTLVSRIRWPLIGGSVGAGGLWPARMSRLSWRQRREHSVASILDQASGTYGSHHANLASSDGCSQGSSFGFPHSNPRNSPLQQQQQHQSGKRPFIASHLQQSSPTSSDNSSSRFPLRGRQQQAVSSGVVVSATSNGYKSRAANNDTLAPDHMDAKQQNLFGHLKLTLNRMLDSTEETDKQTNGGCIGQVSIRPLDSDSIHFESFGCRPEATLTNVDQQQDKDPMPSTSDSVAEMDPNQAETVSRAPNETVFRSSTFIGQPTSGGSNQQGAISRSPESCGQKQVVSINISRPKLESNPKVENLRRNQELAGSSSSSVVSLISMSSSISNKINAAVQRTGEHTATGSDVSSLDSCTLFNGATPVAGSKTAAQVGSSTVSALHKKSAAPPPPPPPPPPCLVQVGGRLVIESLRQAAEKQAAAIAATTAATLADASFQFDSKPASSYTKPFSARPQDPLVDSPSSLDPRRPLPQNPQHVKLRQQASSCINQQQTSKNRQHQATGHSRKQSSRSVTSSTNFVNGKPRPPTPPPLPGQPLAPNTKTVSPTTSVDRGYESLQSYTSSSQQQQLLNTGRSPTTNRGTRKDLPSSWPNRAPSQQPSKLATPIEVQSSVGQRRLSVGEEEFSGGLSGGDTAARVRRAGQTLASGALVKSSTTMSTAHRLNSTRHQGSSRSSDNAKSETISAVDQRQPLMGRSGSLIQKRSRRMNLDDKLDYETEDDDFYYCYDRLAASLANHPAAPPPGAMGSSLLGNNQALSDYVSHAYLKPAGSGDTECEFVGHQLRPACHYDQPAQVRSLATGVFVPQSASANKLTTNANGSDLMMVSQALYCQHQTTGGGAETHSTAHHNKPADYGNHHHHHHHHHHRYHHHSHNHNDKSTRNQQMSNRHHHSLYSAAYAAKKQLTWSDQVGVG